MEYCLVRILLLIAFGFYYFVMIAKVELSLGDIMFGTRQVLYG